MTKESNFRQNLKLQNESMEVTIEQNRKTIRNLQGELGETVCLQCSIECAQASTCFKSTLETQAIRL